MGQSLTFGKKIALGFGLSLAILLVVCFIAFRSTDVLIENNANVTHSQRVLEESSKLLSLLKDAETGQRGFVITGDEAYLAPYNEALGGIASTMAGLREVTSESPRQQHEADEAGALIRDKLAELKHTIEMRRSSGFEPTQKFMQGNAGKALMDDLRKVLGALDQEERDLLRTRSESAEASASHAKTTIASGTLLAFLLVGIAAFLIEHSELLDRATGGRDAAGFWQPRAVFGDERSVDDDSRAPRDLASDRRERSARGANRGGNGERGAYG
jgi:CHASE3 domain sensor protein